MNLNALIDLKSWCLAVAIAMFCISSFADEFDEADMADCRQHERGACLNPLAFGSANASSAVNSYKRHSQEYQNTGSYNGSLTAEQINDYQKVDACLAQVESKCRMQVYGARGSETGVFGNKASGNPGEPQEQQPTSTAGDGTTPPGLPTHSQVEAMKMECDDKKQNAEVCCGDPVKCVSEDSEFSMGNMQLITALVQAGGQLGGGGIKEQCERSQKLNNFGALANGAMAVTCQNTKGDCEDLCQQRATELHAHKANCEAAQASGTAQYDCNMYSLAASHIEGRQRMCQGMSGQVAVMGTQAVQQAVSAKMAKACADAANADVSNFVNNGNVDNTDCSDPANASNPFCRNCSNPANANDPVCQQINPNGTHNSASNSYDASGGGQFGSSGDGFSLGDDDATGDQGTNFGQGDFASSKTSGIGRGGGGVPNSGGSGGGGLGGKGGGKGHGKSKFKTDTLGGVSGGGGYSVSGMGFQNAGGGSRGFNAREYTAKKRMKKFNLKDFVPKVHKKLLDRAPAGQIARDIGSAHSTNVFQKVHNLFYRHCKTGSFYDCKGIQKQKIVLQPAAAASLNSVPAAKGRSPASVAMRGNNKSCVANYKRRYCVKKYANQACYKKADAYCK